MDVYGVVGQEVGDDEASTGLYGILGEDLGDKAEYVGVEAVAVVGHPLDEVLLGRLGHHLLAGGERVLLAAEAVVGRIGAHHRAHVLVRVVGYGLEVAHAELLAIELPGELVAVDEQHLAAEDVDGAADHQVAVLVVVDGERAGLQVVQDVAATVEEVADDVEHGARRLVARLAHVYDLHGELLATQECRARLAARVGRQHLEHLDRVVRQMVEQLEAAYLAELRVAVVPHARVAQHVAVVLEELLERVDLLVGSERILRAVLLHAHVLVRVLGRLDRVRHAHAQLGEEVARELVAAHQLELFAVDLDLLLHVEVLARVERVVVGLRTRYAVARHNHALIVAGVLRARLDHLHRVVLQVEEHAHIADAILLARALHHRLLEVGLEAQHLLVERHPRRLIRAFAFSSYYVMI